MSSLMALIHKSILVSKTERPMLVPIQPQPILHTYLPTAGHWLLVLGLSRRQQQQSSVIPQENSSTSQAGRQARATSLLPFLPPATDPTPTHLSTPPPKTLASHSIHIQPVFSP
ncbi:unnamed protein product [Arctogadus glacialis]